MVTMIDEKESICVCSWWGHTD